MKPAILARARARRRAAGIGIVTAIFLLVVIAGLGAAVVSLLTAQQSTIALDVQSARAYQAARAGVEWALYEALEAKALNCPQTYSFGFQPLTALNGFKVTVSCGTPVVLNGTSHYWIKAIACNEAACPSASPGPDYVQRVVEVQL